MLLYKLFVLALPLVVYDLHYPTVPKEVLGVVQQQGQGILYIDKLPPSELFATAGKGSSTMEGYDDTIEAREKRSARNYTFYIEVVGIKKVQLTQQAAITLKGLRTSKRYLLKVYAEDSRTVVTSFYFSFKSKDSNKLRLWYHPFYNSWRLEAIK